MRRRGPRPVAAALDALTAELEPPTLIAAVQRVWPATAGAPFSTHARPVREKDGTVTVVCAESVVAEQLALMSELVREALNEALGRPAVTSLRVRGPGG